MNENASNVWDPCPPGEVTQLVARMAYRKMIFAIATAGTILLAGTVVAFTARYAISPTATPASSPSSKFDRSGELEVRKPIKRKSATQ